MTSSHRVEIQVGIAVLLAVVILVVGLLWFQQYAYRAVHVEVRARFDTVGGLARGDEVHVRGIPLGKIKRVDLAAHGVDVTLEVDGRVKLTDHARLVVEAVGLAGERIMSVDPGDGAPVDLANHVFEGTYAPAVTEMSEQFQDLTGRVSAVLARLDRLLAQVEEAGGIGDAVKSGTRAAHGLADLLDRNGDAFTRSTRSLAHLSAQMDSLVSGPGKRITAGAERLAGMSARVDTLLTDMDVAADAAADILTAIRQQRGSVGRMIYSDSLAVETERTIQDLRALIADVKRNPKRYLGLTLVDF